MLAVILLGLLLCVVIVNPVISVFLSISVRFVVVCPASSISVGLSSVIFAFMIPFTGMLPVVSHFMVGAVLSMCTLPFASVLFWSVSSAVIVIVYVPSLLRYSVRFCSPCAGSSSFVVSCLSITFSFTFTLCPSGSVACQFVMYGLLRFVQCSPSVSLLNYLLCITSLDV